VGSNINSKGISAVDSPNMNYISDAYNNQAVKL
jgi:hypothetical protein